MGERLALARMDGSDPELFEELIAAVERVAARGAFVDGDEVEAFEREFAAYCEVDHAIGVSSGTDALQLVLRALGIGPGDEVIVPANSFIATAEAVSLTGATPRLVDVDPDSHTLTASIVADALSPRTRCVIPVHLYGRTAELDPIVALAREAGIAVVEDACQAHGARYRGRRAGTIGDAGCFSFYPSKNLGAWGDGGAVVTGSTELADRVRRLGRHGQRERHDHSIVGTTSRLDGIQAAVLRVKLRRLEDWNAERRRAGAALSLALSHLDVELPQAPPDGHDHVFHLYVIGVDDRARLTADLAERGIASGVHYPTPIHLTPAYASSATPALPVVERLAGRICSLPVFPGIEDEQIDRIAAAVAESLSGDSGWGTGC